MPYVHYKYGLTLLGTIPLVNNLIKNYHVYIQVKINNLSDQSMYSTL